MPVEATSTKPPPYLSAGPSVFGMAMWCLAALGILGALYSVVYDPFFMVRLCGYILLGLALEIAYVFLSDGTFKPKSGSSMLTTAILVMSIPPTVPFLPLLFAMIVAIFLAKLSGVEDRLRLNPALVGRLFLMLAFSEEIVGWTRKGLDLDAVSTATPLELFHSEGSLHGIGQLLTGRIGGSWEGMYEIVPGGPGEIFTPVILTLAVVLVVKGVLDWRLGTAFLISFAATCAVLREPVLFNLATGAVVFAAVFIGGDPRTTPASKGGRWTAGIIAGIVNALIRKYTVYSEGIVFSFLLINLLAPSLDRMAFFWRGGRLMRKQAAFERTIPSS